MRVRVRVRVRARARVSPVQPHLAVGAARDRSVRARAGHEDRPEDVVGVPGQVRG